MSGRDRISELPESLLTHILSCLPTRDSVKTSILSTRWKNLYLSVPVLDLVCSSFPYRENKVLIRFLDKFLEFNPELSLLRVNVKCGDVEIEGLKDRIGKAVDRGVRYLDVRSSTYYLEAESDIYPFIEFVPLNLYTSKTLVSLKLLNSGLEDPGFVSLPCLKLLHLVNVHWCSHSDMEKLLSGCPVLEELTLLRNMLNDIEGTEDEIWRVRSRSLKRFYIPRIEEGFYGHMECELEIDAPGLEYMSLEQDHFDRIVVKNLTSLDTIDLDIKFIIGTGVYFDPEDISKRDEIREFLNGISNVKHMIVSWKTMKTLGLYSKAGLIPTFNNLSRLQVGFPCSLLQFLPAFLESCPNLKHLIMKVVYGEEVEAFELKEVPQCFLTTLECVEIRGLSKWEEGEMKMARYFLENAQVLKKLVFNYPRYVSDSKIYEELNKVAKRSPCCSVILDGELC